MERAIETQLPLDLVDLFFCGAIRTDDHGPNVTGRHSPAEEEHKNRNGEEDFHEPGGLPENESEDPGNCLEGTGGWWLGAGRKRTGEVTGDPVFCAMLHEQRAVVRAAFLRVGAPRVETAPWRRE